MTVQLVVLIAFGVVAVVTLALAVLRLVSRVIEAPDDTRYERARGLIGEARAFCVELAHARRGRCACARHSASRAAPAHQVGRDPTRDPTRGAAR